MCKGKNFIDFPIGNTYKTNKQAGGNIKNLLNKSQRLPADIPLKHLRSFPKLSTINGAVPAHRLRRSAS